MRRRWIYGILAGLLIMSTPMQASAQRLSWTRTESSALLWTIADAPIYNGCSTNTSITKVLGVIPVGQLVQITGYCDSGTELFYAVTYQGVTGYVPRQMMDAPVHYEVIKDYLTAVSGGSLEIYSQEQLAQLILSAILVPGMTDMQKAASIHDYLCMTVSYDETLEKLTTKDALVYGDGVCQSYANAFQMLAQAAGIHTDFVGGFALEDGMWINHAWNRCLVDGKYYYIDATWDDEGDFAGRKRFWTTDATLGGTHFAYAINPERAQ